MLINLLILLHLSIVLDKAYRAVLAKNQALDAYKYHLVGGAAGTVSPSKYSIGICLTLYVLSAFFSFFFTISRPCLNVNIQWVGRFKVVTLVQWETAFMVSVCLLC